MPQGDSVSGAMTISRPNTEDIAFDHPTPAALRRSSVVSGNPFPETAPAQPTARVGVRVPQHNMKMFLKLSKHFHKYDDVLFCGIISSKEERNASEESVSYRVDAEGEDAA
ncbi:MAG: hypothetical protein HYX78_11225 [Armatimonadetes bacterium]|nr:hypothetical protein [Armatimonadota bacterium]